MLSKFSNTASVIDIEDFFGLTLDHSYLHVPKNVIKGLHEATVCIITNEKSDRIQHGIWGILPKGYEDSWQSFQDIYNTLEIECEAIPETSWLYEALKYRRCLIVATGYYTSRIEDNKIHDIKHELKTESVFCFAGIYNVLEDGFITCSILSHTNGSASYHLKDAKPIILSHEHYERFLRKDFVIQELYDSTLEIDRNLFKEQKKIDSPASFY